MRFISTALLAALAVCVVAGLCNASTDSAVADASAIKEQVSAVQKGRLLLSFEARPGVRGDGDSINFRNESDDWEDDCEEGPVRVRLDVREGSVERVKVRVGGRWTSHRDDIVDLGTVPAPAAADYLLSLAEEGKKKVAERAILAAILAADAVVWPRLLSIARDESRPSDVRETAIFWFGQLAGEKVTEGLEKLVVDEDADLDIREHAVFALSQRPADESIPVLSHIALNSPHPQLRETALFWLAQRDDPRVLSLLERILLDEQ